MKIDEDFIKSKIIMPICLVFSLFSAWVLIPRQGWFWGIAIAIGAFFGLKIVLDLKLEDIDLEKFKKN